MAYIIREDYAPKFTRTMVAFPDGYDALEAFFASTYAYVDSYTRANWLSGTPIPAEVVPTTAKISKGDKLYDWLTIRGGATLVSGRFKNCVEQLDPGRHQFFPLTVMDKQGVAKPNPFFMFNIVGYIDSIIGEQSNLRSARRDFIPSWNYSRCNGPWKCAMDKSVIGDRACWTEYHYTFAWFVSDRLAALLKQEGLLGFDLDDLCEEVSA